MRSEVVSVQASNGHAPIFDMACDRRLVQSSSPSVLCDSSRGGLLESVRPIGCRMWGIIIFREGSHRHAGVVRPRLGTVSVYFPRMQVNRHNHPREGWKSRVPQRQASQTGPTELIGHRWDYPNAPGGFVLVGSPFGIAYECKIKEEFRKECACCPGGQLVATVEGGVGPLFCRRCDCASNSCGGWVGLCFVCRSSCL
ncbi:hypothetical protein CRG98_006535 [Punica granatum]|uniref:Uncharacterized protein n=1 Tax=Punica granatum TaxID=22663 RepID=A0A2I0KXH3_PUNGR|nr:hypothetical protein CRG98_006535 [Punica granatum]